MRLVFRYEAPPPGETAFELPEGEAYEREFWKCETCSHYLSTHQLDLSDLYRGTYIDATYGDHLVQAYERVMALPPERSDNVQRVHRLVEAVGVRPPNRTVLDVGSGLGVFPARMQEAGWRCTALDPDPRAAEHLRTHVGVETVCADFMDAHAEVDHFDLVTFNKVLEHVEDPVTMLARARDFLGPMGSVYIEVPDGECAAADGPGREEFFIEHLWAFSIASLCLLSSQAGFLTYRVERLREPSGKYTLFAMLRPRPPDR